MGFKDERKILQIMPCNRRINALLIDDDNATIFKAPVLGFALNTHPDYGFYISPLVFDPTTGIMETTDMSSVSIDGFEADDMKEDMKGEDDNADTGE